MSVPSYSLIRSGRKSIALSVDPTGALIVRAPYHVDTVQIEALLHRYAGWILKKQAQAAAESAEHPPFVFCAGAPLPYLGRPYALFFSESPGISLSSDALQLPFGTDSDGLTRWLRGQATELLAERTERFAAVMGVSFQGITVTGARTRWGSCSAANRLSFTWRLIFCEPPVIDYVVVHELAHIEHKNHGPAFWARVQSVLPSFAEQRNWLKRNGRLLQIL